MRKYFRYLWYIIRRKFYIGIECVRHGLFLRAITHDLSNLLPSEFIPFAQYHYGFHDDYCDNLEYRIALLKYYHKTQYHWQYWILQQDNGHTTTLQMPDKYAKEMACDWVGTCKAMKTVGDALAWYEDHKDNMVLHPSTRAQVRRLLGVEKKSRAKIDDLTTRLADNFPTLNISTKEAGTIIDHVIGTTYDYVTAHEDEITSEEGTLTPQRAVEMDAEKKELRAEQQKQIDE